MKKSLIVLICFAAFLFSGTVIDQKFGHINLNDIVDLMPEKDSAEVKIQKYYKELLDELDVMNVEYNKKLQEYTSKQNTYTDLIKQSKEDDLRSLQQRIQQFQQQADQSLQDKRVEKLNEVIGKAKKVIAEVAKEQKLIYVFNVGNLATGVDAVLYHSDESIDIGPLVMKKMNLKPKPTNTTNSNPKSSNISKP
jgi:outer membrane protein